MVLLSVKSEAGHYRDEMDRFDRVFHKSCPKTKALARVL
jgi:hypothetical protein